MANLKPANALKMTARAKREAARIRMATWRKNNTQHARRLDRRARWRKLGFHHYEGEAKGGMNVPIETQRKARELRKTLNGWNYEYYVLMCPSVTDADYDAVYAELKALEQEWPDIYDPNSPTQRVGAASISTFDKVKHRQPMLSLEKVKTTGELVGFFSSDADGVMEPKVDGLSLDVTYVNGRLAQAVTRGDGTFGQDVTHNARTIRTLPLTLRRSVTIRVRGEVFIKWSDFAALNTKLEAQGEEASAHPRTAAAGAMMLKRPADAAAVPLSFIAYSVVGDVEGESLLTHTDELELMEGLGFLSTLTLPAPLESCESMFQASFKLNNEAELADLVVRLEKSRRVQDFPTDGLVVKVNDLALQQEMGVSTKAPRWAVAFKFPPDRLQTRIQSIEWTIGKSGKITPVAVFDPVILGGATVTRASLVNGDEIARLRVNVGDDVMVEKSNEIIPKVMTLVAKRSKTTAQVPKTCPVCASALVKPDSIVDSYCISDSCAAQAEQRLVFATGKSGLDIDGCGPQLVKLCLANGVKTLPALLLEKDFKFLKGAARKKMIEGVQKAYKAPFWRKLAALCIAGWGKQTCQKVAAVFPTMKRVWSAYTGPDDKPVIDSTKLIEVAGRANTEAFTAFVARDVSGIEQLMDAGFFTDDVEKVEESGVQGKSFCITGALPGVTNRADAESEVLRRGGQVKGSVSKKLDFLVVGTGGGATKADAAKRWGTRCLTPEEFYDMLGWRPGEGAGDDGSEY